jgi:hypothetical protein
MNKQAIIILIIVLSLILIGGVVAITTTTTSSSSGGGSPVSCQVGQVAGTTSNTNMNCYRKPTDTEIGDKGYGSTGKWLDIEGTGHCFNYCRLVGPSLPPGAAATATPVNLYSCTSQVKNGYFEHDPVDPYTPSDDRYNMTYTGWAAADPNSLQGKIWKFYTSGDPVPTPCTI